MKEKISLDLAKKNITDIMTNFNFDDAVRIKNII